MIIFVLMSGFASAGSFIDVVQDDFNRDDGVMGTATNGNSWSSTGTYPPVISSNTLDFSSASRDTNSFTTLVFDNVISIGNNISFSVKGDDVSDPVHANVYLRDSSNDEICNLLLDDTIVLNGAYVQAKSDNTWYKITINIFSSTQVKLYVDDVYKTTSSYEDAGAGDIDKIVIKFYANSGISHIWFDNIDSNINATNFSLTSISAFTGNDINNFSVVIDGTTFNTSSGSISTNIYYNDSSLHDLTIFGDGLANITYTDINTSSNYVAEVYYYNDILVYAFDGETGNTIEDFNVTLYNNYNYYFNTSSDNYSYFPSVISGEYVAGFVSSGYSNSYYIVTLAEGSYQVLNIYASDNSSSDSVILTAYDTSSNGILEGVLITQRKILDGNYVVIESKTTDISGRAQFTYFENIPYSFIASKDNYTTKTFQLTPLFDSYTLNMDPSTTTNNDVYNDDVIVTLLDDNFVNGSSWVTYSFLSPLGSLEYYNVEVTLDNGTSYNFGDTVAVGSYINATFTAGSVVFGDSALVTITYKSTLNSGVRGNSRVFLFTTWGEPSGGLESLKADIEVYSPLERIFWLTVLMISLASLFSIFGFASGEYFVFGSVGGIFGVVIGGLIGLVGWLSAGFVIFILLLFILGRLLNDG